MYKLYHLDRLYLLTGTPLSSKVTDFALIVNLLNGKQLLRPEVKEI